MINLRALFFGMVITAALLWLLSWQEQGAPVEEDLPFIPIGSVMNTENLDGQNPKENREAPIEQDLAENDDEADLPDNKTHSNEGKNEDKADLGESLSVKEQGGFHNPMEMALIDAPYQKPSIPTCQAGYLLTKSGQHDPAFLTHKNCAEAGFTRSMIWLAYIYQNGLIEGGENPELSAYWDERAAQSGNEVGMFNYGIDLIRGYGVARDVKTGQDWIAKAAQGGHKHAQELIDANFDLSVVTPDADEARWAEYQ